MLIPNERGLDNALALRERRGSGRFDEVNVFLSATETHNRKNVNRSIEESLTGLERVLRARARGGPALRGRDLGVVRLPLRGRGRRPSACSGSPAAGRRRRARRSASATRPGWRTRAQVRAFFAARASGSADVELTAHFHNTRGQGLANVLAALEAGLRRASSRASASSAAARCPPGATGNIATEDLVSMLHEMGIETGIDLDALLAQARAVRDVLGRPLGSHTLIAGPVDWHTARRG